MAITAKYTHTNLTSANWERLASFYCKVFGCSPRPPERDLSGEWLSKLTRLNSPRLRGVHLTLPGTEPNGPTLEIFQYDEMVEGALPQVNRPGFGHIAFHVEDVGAAVKEIKANGGGMVGEEVRTNVPGVGILTVAYARDPDGNILEIQNWKKQ